ncbi:regulator of protease activity HflC (stomatin/prohibitin superfamily) [Skermanella aerolata]|uniref:hypothetical protein n=1 Tax=Skermanella aerolata TaxID=393310 RepID=UPI003D24F328
MTALPGTDPFETRLRTFIARLSACETTGDRDLVLAEIAERAKVILNSRPALMHRWLLGLDRVNRKFASPAQPES